MKKPDQLLLIFYIIPYINIEIFLYILCTTDFIFYLGEDCSVSNSRFDCVMNGGYIKIIIWNEIILYSILLQQKPYFNTVMKKLAESYKIIFKN